ncbi:hypothetical protein ABIA54_004532 [Pseudomonas sp. EB276 TE3739]|uniref:hypothetical protein n=1 Tax=Pseudomonas TaxID=286 RepID=UPI00209F1FC3|nr:hypothetical protein [Pseudomonas koreensis]MCP1476622.1 hypothetical protein [Pseudomonas koreensis]
MCTLTHFATSADAGISTPLTVQVADLSHLPTSSNNRQTPHFQVVPAGIAFFHIKEISTGRVRGFRGNHNEACALARSLESKIELRADDCLR